MEQQGGYVMLDRLARTVLARPRALVLAWGVLVVVGAVAAIGVFGQLASRGSAVSGSESERATTEIARHMPGHAGSQVLAVATIRNPVPHVPGRYVVRRGLSLAYVSIRQMRIRARQDLEEKLRRLPEVAGVRQVVATTTTRNRGREYAEGIAVLSISLSLDPAAAENRLPALRAEAEKASGRFVSIGLIGGLAISERYSAIARDDLARAEAIALPLTAAVLLVAFLSVFAAALPIVLALATLSATLIFLYLIGLQVGLSVFVTNTASVLALGLSVDFSLFMVMRYREELAASQSMTHALRRTMTTTGRAVVLSGATIAAALLSLSAVGIGIFSSMALGAALATLIAVLAATTLLPALICMLGPRIDRMRLPGVATAADRGTLWRFLAHVSTSHPVGALVASGLVLLALALPALSMSLSVTTVNALPEDDPVRQEVRHLVEVFGAGAGGPVQIVTKQDPSDVASIVRAERGVERVWERTHGRRGWAAMQAILETSPDAPAAQGVVERLRARLGTAAHPTHVGGLTATTLDVTGRVSSRAPFVILVAVLVGMIVLAVGLQSILIPVKAVLGTLMSTAAALGVVCLAFGSSLEFFVPLFVFAIVFGLSIDYEVFLISRVREFVDDGYATRSAVSRGLVASGRSITLAAVTLATIFAALTTSTLGAFQQLGAGVALAVLIDATLVRCVLVPASITVLGKWNWWLPKHWPARSHWSAERPAAAGEASRSR